MGLIKCTDERLWQLVRKGKPEALSLIFKSKYEMLFNFAFSLCHNEELAKDSIQEMFIYLWEKRSQLSEVVSVRAYLLASLRRLIIKSIKKKKTEEDKNKAIIDELPKEAFSPLDMIIIRECNEQTELRLKKALEAIPDRIREALYLKTYSNLSYKEISVVMSISSQVARNYVSEAFHRLRKFFSKEN